MSLSLDSLSQALPSPTSATTPSSTSAAPRPTVTASPTSSIWTDLPEPVFRQHVVELEKLTNSVPVDAQTFPLPPPGDGDSDGPGPNVGGRNSASAGQPRRLSLASEQRLADDITYLVAVGEGAQSVAAATVQETCRLEGKGPALRVAIASVDAIEPSSQTFLRSVFQQLSSSSSSSSSSSPSSSPAECSELPSSAKTSQLPARLLDEVTRHHQSRLLNRLRSSKWKKPAYLARTHKKPLHADFANLVHRAQFLYTKKEAPTRAQLERDLLALAATLEAFETTTDDHASLVAVVRSSYHVCTSPLVAAYLQRLQAVRPTTQIQACLKTLRQLEKIAAYYRICLSLNTMSQSLPNIFDDVELLFLPPYEPVPLTTVAYQPWAKSTHVHAEVILSVHHDLEAHRPQPGGPSWYPPRCLGASKYFCYLCFLFIRHHGAYFAANTHGACYDQWTVPDLADYPETLARRYGEVLRAMDSEIQNRMQGAVWRPEPMTSRENLIGTIGE
ncbi:hypothetical protein CPLU01_05614 [Colletotrichum plurivorum]|uniref:Uncharacterized protein n=1 Tax=Colletotrichum plurivorum TaxID=2175906 RepID=A0A8H6KL43_9PEZI|nr:hypothetical protein CPLU01_05614 [Colletotrichum plurivorum]